MIIGHYPVLKLDLTFYLLLQRYKCFRSGHPFDGLNFFVKHLHQMFVILTDDFHQDTPVPL